MAEPESTGFEAYLNFCGETLGHGALFLIPNNGLLFQREQKTYKSIDCPCETGTIPRSKCISIQRCCLWVHVDREAVRINRVVVRVKLLKSPKIKEKKSVSVIGSNLCNIIESWQHSHCFQPLLVQKNVIPFTVLLPQFHIAVQTLNVLCVNWVECLPELPARPHARPSLQVAR